MPTTTVNTAQLSIDPVMFEKSDKMHTAIATIEEDVSSSLGKGHYNDWPNDYGVIQQRDQSHLIFTNLVSSMFLKKSARLSSLKSLAIYQHMLRASCIGLDQAATRLKPSKGGLGLQAIGSTASLRSIDSISCHLPTPSPQPG